MTDPHTPVTEPTPTPSTRPLLPATGAWMPGMPVGERRFATVVDTVQGGRALSLEGGGSLRQVDVAYETWGSLNEAGDNAILLFHALTGDSHAAGRSGRGHPTEGWWSALIGPGRAFDTDRYLIVCSNVLGGCQGTTGPASIDPTTGRPYGPTFPVVTIRDMVRVQARLADHLGIACWLSVVGGSMGGMQALEWSVMYPHRIRSLVAISTTAAASAEQIAWSHVGRSAVQADPRFRDGWYYGAEPGDGPQDGLMVARRLAQITYRTEPVYRQRFDRTLRDPGRRFGLEPQFEVEHYLDYHGAKLVRRFDANSYLRLNRAMDLHDLGRGRGGLSAALGRVRVPAMVMAVRSDTLYPPYQQEEIARHLESAGRDVWFEEVDSLDGHDAFLTETARLAPQLRAFLTHVDTYVPVPEPLPEDRP